MKIGDNNFNNMGMGEQYNQQNTNVVDNTAYNNNIQGVSPTGRESRLCKETGVVEKYYIYTCPFCGEKREVKGKELDMMADYTVVQCYRCNQSYSLIKATAADYKEPSLMDTFGEFITPDKNGSMENNLEGKNVDEVLTAIRDSFGINITKESLNKLPVGIKKILKDILSV
jgi:transcription elongation factor Elf1